MTLHFKRLALSLIALLLAATISLGAASSQKHVIVVSIDGMLPDYYLSPEKYGLKIPTLRSLKDHGSYSTGALSVFPTLTYPSHTSMVTGVNPAKHGIYLNKVFDPLGEERGAYRWYAQDIRVPTVYQLAQRHGLKTALVWWPVSVGAEADWVFPEMWRVGTKNDAKLLRVLSTPGLFDAVQKQFGRLYDYAPGQVGSDPIITDVAVYLIEHEKPNLMLVHLPDVDHFEHKFGPGSREALAAVEIADQQLSRMVAAVTKYGLADSTYFVVVSDHGFLPVEQRIRASVLLKQSGFIKVNDRNRPVDWLAAATAAGGMCEIRLKNSNDLSLEEKVWKLFQGMTGKPDSPLAHVYTREEIAARGGDPEAFLMLEAAPGFSFSSGLDGEVISASRSRATHGYHPELPQLKASLMVAGRGIRHGEIHVAPHSSGRLIDVAPTVANLLGFRMENIEGQTLNVEATTVSAK